LYSDGNLTKEIRTQGDAFHGENNYYLEVGKHGWNVWLAQIKNLIMKYLIFIAIVFSSCSPTLISGV
jgi:hypothetical protein